MFNRKSPSYFRFLPVQLIVGIGFCTLLPFVLLGWVFYGSNFLEMDLNNSIMSGFLTIIVIMTLHNMRRFPGIVTASYILPVIVFWFTLLLVLMQLFYFDYSLLYYCLCAALLLVYLFVVDIINRQYKRYLFAYIPVGRAQNMPEQIPAIEWVRLETPELNSPVHAIVTDLHSYDLTGEWEKFIADKTLQGIPVYHHRNIRESLTGRVRINHLYENDLGSLLPSENYMIVKYCMDSLIILALLPFTLIIFLLTAIAIKYEDGGKIFYVQPRVGYRGEIIKVYKFRSMREKAKEVLTVDNDNRITKVGKFIRKTRVDELPQFINVIKGEMSLIGPRAEFIDFAVRLEEQVPFFNYRHIIKPGISGWAQVNQGYATGAEETKLKIEYDFYYIKNFSFSLDMLIFFKTIFTTLTGFGAR